MKKGAADEVHVLFPSVDSRHARGAEKSQTDCSSYGSDTKDVQ